MRRTIPMALLAIATLAGVAFVAAAPVSAAPLTFDVTLNSANEVPPNASGSAGAVLISVDPVTDEVCWAFGAGAVSGEPTGVHIHHAAAGVNGPIVVTLGLVNGCSTVAAALADDIVAHPSDYYVNIHTVLYPGGEIRGQLVPRVIRPPLTLDTPPTTTTTAPTTVPETSQPITTEPEITTTTSVTSTTTGTGVRPASGARPVSGRPTFTG